MVNYYLKYLVPLFYMIPAFIAFYIGFILRKKSFRVGDGVNYPKILFYICIAEGLHNSYYFIATLVRNFDVSLYEAMMLPVPWLFAQGVVTVTFLVFAVYFVRARDVELGDIRMLTETVNRFRELALIDPLTSLNNRRSMQEIIEKEKKRADRMYRPFTLMMLDLDGFKKYNDVHGHNTGDTLLVDVARVIKSSLRDYVDISFRYGGDEFFIVMPETTLSDARIVADRLRDAINNMARGEITLSIGLLEVSPDCNMKTDDMIRLTDLVMYSAKKDGGNQISCLTA